MRIHVYKDNEDFYIEFKDPQTTELKEENDRLTPEELYTNKKLEMLTRLLTTGCKYKLLSCMQ